MFTLHSRYKTKKEMEVEHSKGVRHRALGGACKDVGPAMKALP